MMAHPGSTEKGFSRPVVGFDDPHANDDSILFILLTNYNHMKYK